jgi:hypothetical protein
MIQTWIEAIRADRKQDGSFLDGHGNPLPDGQEKVILEHDVYSEIDFNAFDFGRLVSDET